MQVTSMLSINGLKCHHSYPLGEKRGGGGGGGGGSVLFIASQALLSGQPYPCGNLERTAP